jgi:predicted HTH transcriptional regulator
MDIRSHIAKGEGISLEFKTCRSSLPRDVYETVCAFLNRHGGTLLLGVNDDGKITGVESDSVEQIKKDCNCSGSAMVTLSAINIISIQYPTPKLK